MILIYRILGFLAAILVTLSLLARIQGVEPPNSADDGPTYMIVMMVAWFYADWLEMRRDG